MDADERRRREKHRRWVAALPAEIREAHKRSSHHREEVLGSSICGCFGCLRTFPPSEIQDWTDFDSAGVGTTAICPHCSVDSILGDLSGFPITAEFLTLMEKHWFGLIDRKRRAPDERE